MTILSDSLRMCREFARVSAEVRALLAERMHSRAISKGEQLMKQGAPGDCLMLLIEGAAAVTLTRDDGTERVLGFFKPGEIFGEMALLTKEPRSANVWADSDGRVLVLGAAEFEALANAHPEVAVVLTNLVAERLGTKQVDALGGKTLDRYRIARCVGRGSMAVVYEATDTVEKMRVALKMMSHRLVYEPGARERFDREAKILLSFRHPNIARMFRSFDAFKTRFIAMEYCDGPALATLLKHIGPLDEKAARTVLGQLAAAVECLHGQDVVHRDLKPGNVMFLRNGTLKLMDFGLALPGHRPEQEEDEDEGGIVGTPLYMAPEVLSGGAPTIEADRYAFGCIAYELLTGKHAFQTNDLYELTEMKLTFELPPRTAIGRGISREVAELLERLLSPDPAQRRMSLSPLAQWAKPFDPELLDAAQRGAEKDKITRL